VGIVWTTLIVSLKRTFKRRIKKYKERFYYVMMDFNNLKKVNDSYGHTCGDAYLMEFAKLLKFHSRETDLLIRVGGDEFVGMFF
jgi:diguanylate cyclase (GGDEF)-like protein